MLAAIKRKQKVLQENLKSKDLEIKALKKSNADLEDKQKDKQFDIKAALALKDIEIDELEETNVKLQEKLKSKDFEIKDLKKRVITHFKKKRKKLHISTSNQTGIEIFHIKSPIMHPDVQVP